MNSQDEIKSLLVEIRDNQRVALQRQEEQLAIAQEHLDGTRQQVEKSIGLQREAMARVKTISRIVLPVILLCVGLLVFLLLRFF